jgi:inorganic pyrophosphatase
MDHSDIGDFWQYLDRLVEGSRILIDRPRGSNHPNYPDTSYPLDYGFLEATRAIDASGIDVWVGSNPDRHLEGLICSVDLAKLDVEIKLLLGCSAGEMDLIQAFMNTGSMRTILLRR